MDGESAFGKINVEATYGTYASPTKYYYISQVSQEMLDDGRLVAQSFGFIPETPEEKAKRAVRAAEYRAKRAAAQPRLHDAIRALDAITDQPARLILDLHRRVDSYGWKCYGCDMEGYEAESPAYPCSTTLAIAEHYSIDFTDSELLERPEDGSLDADAAS